MYTTKTQVEDYLQTTIPSNRVTWLNTLISAVKLWIDSYTGRNFESGSETRYYDGNDLEEIIIDDISGTPTISILNDDGSVDRELSTEDYLLYPLNSTVKTSIVLTSDSPYSTFYSGRKRISVVGTFGNSATVPADVQLAATQLVGQVYNGGLTDGAVQSESLGDYSVTFSSASETEQGMTTMSILDHYRVLDI